ncbi:Sugar kinase of the NBD/HSP70 family, may contain an N-terminal HTH domain [Micromonospora sediminicola]|uniref:Sugar kinase of the NBD/HSP70 family, may contain an N-terminal HTH domain n=1 Tax=Micromonospora sediminicola TaxID=946078 RepID=A0A1A9B9W4_9ACTN|nr:ROK family transcriptional regulator [Micromonospora sediminicola]SBT65764.1 Sugar kinase of the NBD/HSP70 family, may contain an N-terminal HTH domain [Micromonospora sediminicola]
MAATRPGSKRLLRDINRHLVLQLIAEHGPLSRTDLARRGQLTASTITHIVADFAAAGLITETAAVRASAGRQPVLVDLAPQTGHLVGIKLRDDDMTVVVADLRCSVVHALEAPVAPDAAPREAVEMISAAIEKAVREAGVPRESLLGVGVGVPGVVDAARRRIVFSHARGWRDADIGGWLESRLGVPVWIDNVVNTLAMGLNRFGAGRDAGDFLVVTVGRGIGLGAVLGGGLFRGAHGAASDFGHTTVDASPYAPHCNCGKRGCLEAVASDYGIVRAVLGHDPGLTVEDHIDAIVDRARSGDERLRELFRRAGESLGVAIANLINLFDPALVLLAGEGLRAKDLFLDRLRAAVPLHTPGHRPDELYVELLDVTDQDWARGAAAIVLHELLRSPVWTSDRPPLIHRLLPEAAATA